MIDEIVAPLNAARVPFSTTQGVRFILLTCLNLGGLTFGLQNHDNQVNITHAEEISREHLVAPLSYTRFAPPGVGGESGPGNYWVPVRLLSYTLSQPSFNICLYQVYKKESGMSDELPILASPLNHL